MIRSLYNKLASLRLALYLILALVIVLLLGQWIPQRNVVSREAYLQWKSAMPQTVSALEWAGLTRIYTSPLTLAVWSVFFLNLTVVMIQRAGIVRKKLTIVVPADDAIFRSTAYPVGRTIPLRKDMDHDALSKTFRKSGYMFYGTKERFLLLKNRFAPVATILFHVSFFLLLIGAVVMAYTRFTATVDIAEGEDFDGRLERYQVPVRLPKVGEAPDVRFLVERIQPVIEQGVPVGLVVDIVTTEGERHTVEVNRPYTADGTSFVIKDYGVAPLIVLRDAAGRELDGAYVKLNILQKPEDRFSMHEMDFSVELFPAHGIVDGKTQTRSLELKDPVFRFTVHEGRKLLTTATITPGNSFLVKNYRLFMPEYRYWIRFLVVKEQGWPLLYGGFVLAVVALLWRFLFYRCEFVGTVRVENERSVLVLAGRSEFYRTLLEDELQRMTADIAATDE